MWQERRNGHFDGRAAAWRDLLKAVVMPDGPDDHVVELHLNQPEPIVTTYLSANCTTVISSKCLSLAPSTPGRPMLECWVVLSMKLSGDWLRDRLDPILRNR